MLRHNEVSQEDLSKICYEAVDYATSYIQLGMTQHAQLGKEVDARTQMIHHSISEIQAHKIPAGSYSDIIRIDPDEKIYTLNKEIELIKKYSLGNCLELAKLAFDYIVKCYPMIQATLCRIKNGDHVFVILNLPPEYNLKDEKSLDSAMICDAWSAWSVIRKLKTLPSNKELDQYNRSYLWVEKTSQLYYCNDGNIEIVNVLDEIALKKNLNILFKDSNSELIHPKKVHQLITNNGGHHPAGVVYPAIEYKNSLKNFRGYYEGIQSIKLTHERDFVRTSSKSIALQESKEGKIKAFYNIDKKPVSKEFEKKQLEHLKLIFPNKRGDSSIIKDEIKVGEIVRLCGDAKPAQLFISIDNLSDKHEMSEIINSEYFQNEEYIHRMIDVFLLKDNILMESVERFKLELIEMMKNLDPSSLQKRALISHKIILANGLISELANAIDKYRLLKSTNGDYYKTKYSLQNVLHEQIDKVGRLEHFTKKELKLFEKSKLHQQLQDARVALRHHINELVQNPETLLASSQRAIEPYKISDRLK